MEARIHLLVLGVLVVYTVVLVVLVARNVHALRSHHACADVSTPLCKTLAALLEPKEARPSVFAALAAGRFHGVRIVAFEAGDDVLFDTHGGGSLGGAPPTEAQRELRAAAFAERPAQRLVHRTDGSRMAHTTGATCSDGTAVAVEALAV